MSSQTIEVGNARSHLMPPQEAGDAAAKSSPKVKDSNKESSLKKAARKVSRKVSIKLRQQKRSFSIGSGCTALPSYDYGHANCRTGSL